MHGRVRFTPSWGPAGLQEEFGDHQQGPSLTLLGQGKIEKTGAHLVRAYCIKGILYIYISNNLQCHN